MTETMPEFSRPVALEDLRGGTLRQSIAATADECRRLAERLGLAAIDNLSATVTLDSRRGGKFVVVEGQFQAALTQTCVVTLEPLPGEVSDKFSIRLAPAPESGDTEIVDIDAGTDDEPEPIEGDSVDIGELVAQHLSLALDPYPRAEGVQLEPEALAAGEVADEGPFAKLARLKPKA